MMNYKKVKEETKEIVEKEENHFQNLIE